MNLVIRKANYDDFAAINVIAKQEHELHVTMRPDLYVSVDPVIDQERYRQLLDNYQVFVAEKDGIVVSYAVCFVKEDNNPVKTKRRTFFIDAIGNEENHIGQGIGKKMMEYAEALAKEAACDCLELQVVAVNQEAVGFYDHLGFKKKYLHLEKDI